MTRQSFESGRHYWEIHLDVFTHTVPYLLIGVTPNVIPSGKYCGQYNCGIR